VPAQLIDASGNTVALGQTLINGWLTELLIDNGIDPTKVKVKFVLVETEIGRSHGLVFESIQEGSTLNDFRRFDPWLRGNAWESIHDYWEKTSIDHKIRDNPDLQSVENPGLATPLGNLTAGESSANGGNGDIRPPGFDVTGALAQQVVQAMASSGPVSGDLSGDSQRNLHNLFDLIAAPALT